ncbi:MAG: ribosomal protein S18-alanine N-acetyltransferase [Bacilli bacterium]|nr:ribosomal protein S18-alanine N-acetyltransferase [Bacilli bacterium]
MIRDYTKTDIDAINEIGKLIKEDFANVYKIFELNKDYANIYVYTKDNKVIGFLQYENHYEITDIINIAVANYCQNKGIGEELINYLINNTQADKIMLEVRENNVYAINLYNKCGFIEINRRKKYYDGEDAIIMERKIS